MDGRIPSRSTQPLPGARPGAARTAPLGGPTQAFATDALALGARPAAAPVVAAEALAARRAAEALWAAPAAAQGPASAEAAPGDGAVGAWGGAGAGATVAQDLADLDDPRFAAAYGGQEADRQGAAGENIMWHWRRAGFGGPGGPAKAQAFLERIADGFEQRLAALAQADPAAHARWSRVAGPILGLGDPQTNASAVVLLDRALAGGDWGPLDDLGRRAAHYARGAAHQGAGEQAAALAAKARALLATNAPLERQALAGLTPGERAAHAQVRQALGDDPHARLALQLLAVEGKLGVPAGASLITALGGLAAQPLAAGLERRALLAAVVREVATPTAITQKDGTWTCTVTSAQILVALERPAEYVRIVAGLASPEGRVALASGAPIARVAGTAGPDLTGRTPSSRLWQAALMAHANGADRYDPKLDLSTRPDGSHYKGLIGLEAQERLFGGVTGRAGTLVGGETAGGDPQAALALIKQSLAAGRPVPANYCVREGVAHAIMVTGVADGLVTYADPMGLVKRVPEAEFAKKLFLARVEA